MEKVLTLIDKLCLQKKQNASPELLLHTVQMLHAELLQVRQKSSALGTSKVAVTLPMNLSFVENIVYTAMAATPEEEQDEVVEISPPPVVEKPEYKLYKPAVANTVAQPTLVETKPPVAEPQILNPALHMPADELPFPQYAPKPETAEKEVFTLKQMELHEVIGSTSESLNDRLKEEKTEVAHVITGSPIKDLKKAIGINDRYTFINELFRGDEPMYDRSLKTINSFNIYSEAQYWIARELSSKLGWDENSYTVKHFHQLVRRRFS